MGSVLDRFKQHWFVSIFLICVAVAVATWKVAQEALVAPRDFQITQLRHEIEKLKSSAVAPPVRSSEEENPVVLEQTGVFENSSVTTYDGRCNVRVDHVRGDLVTVTVAIDGLPPQELKDQRVGSRIQVGAGRGYYVDLHRVRGDIVDLSVYRTKR